MNAATLRRNRYYLSAEGINTSLSGSSSRTRELDPISSYRLHQIFVSILFVKYAAPSLKVSSMTNTQRDSMVDHVRGKWTLFLTFREERNGC